MIDKKRVNRSGYDDEAIARNFLYVEADFIDCLECQDPFEYLTKFYRVSISVVINSLFSAAKPGCKALEVFAAHPKVLKLPDDFKDMIKDLKVCGRREYANLLRLHHKYQNIIRNEKFAKEKKAKEESKIAEPVDEDAELDKQLEATLLRIQKEKKKQEKKEKII